jgi:hypothetical protein
MRLVAEFDTDNILFSVKRDADTSAKKKESVRSAKSFY